MFAALLMFGGLYTYNKEVTKNDKLISQCISTNAQAELLKLPTDSCEDLEPNQEMALLQRTGFVFEMRMNEVLINSGYKTIISAPYLDLDEDILREIDLIAYKEINGVLVQLIIECKQSVTDKWIFLANKQLERPIYFINHVPQILVEPMLSNSPFESLDFAQNAPRCHNYLCYSVRNEKEKQVEKEGEHIAIDKCVYILPKALLNQAATTTGRCVFFPVALFSGQMFVVRYKGELDVKDANFLHYVTRLDSDHYLSDERYPRSNRLTGGKRDDIKVINRRYRKTHTIHFVSEAGFTDYLKLIEDGVARIDKSKWPEPS